MDSVAAMKLTNHLEKTFGSLSKTLFFEYQSIAALSEYFLRVHTETARRKFGSFENSGSTAKPALQKSKPTPSRRRKHLPAFRMDYKEDIAIVGVAGRYPQSENL